MCRTFTHRGSLESGRVNMSFNYLELLAVFFGLQSLIHEKEVHVRLQMDSSTALAYLQHKGGTRNPKLSHLAVQIWLWCLDRGIHLSTDTMSRTFNDRTKWHLHPQVFADITQRMQFFPQVDLFASRINTQLPIYVAWLPDPTAWHIDAFTISWNSIQGYLFPPFSLLTRCVQKIC